MRIDRSSFVDFKVTLLYCLILDIMTTLEDLRDVNQSKWTNTVTAFKRQYTMLTTLLTEVKQITKDMVDPKKKVDGKAAKMKVDPIKRKLELLNKYVDSLHNILPSAAVIDEGTWGVTTLNITLSKCMDDAQNGHDELLGLLEEINVWENIRRRILRTPRLVSLVVMVVVPRLQR